MPFGVGLVGEAAGGVVDVGPVAEIRIGDREAAAEGIVGVGPVIAGVVGEAGEAVEQVVLIARRDGGGAQQRIAADGPAQAVAVDGVRAVQLVGDGGFLEAVRDRAEAEALQQLVGIRMVQLDLAVEGVVQE